MKRVFLILLLIIFSACASHFVDQEIYSRPTEGRAFVTHDPNLIIRTISKLKEKKVGDSVYVDSDLIHIGQRTASAELLPGNYRFDFSFHSSNIFTNVSIHSTGGVEANLKAGHKYVIQAKLIENGKKVNYWMLDQTTNQVVSGKRVE